MSVEMVWAVGYSDICRYKRKSDAERGSLYHIHFPSEKEAREYLVKRAEQAVESSENELRISKNRLKKCQKKFGWRLSDE